MSDHQHRWRRTAHLDACHYSSNHLACRCGAMAVTLTERDLADGYAASWGDPEDCERCRALAGGATPIHHVFIRAADGTVERDTSEPLTADSEAGT